MTTDSLSIMIPTFNCAHFLERTLASLSNQPGLEHAHIEIVDNCSSDRPERIAQRVWPNRILFHRHPSNIGAIGNFNACIDRAPTEWIQILHGDDLVSPGAYLEFAAATAAVPEALAVLGRTRFIDASDNPFGSSPSLGNEPRGRFVYDLAQWKGCIVQFAGVLFSRSAIRAVGSFDSHFRHASDWNLWWRIVKSLPVAFTNAIVGDYRVHGSSLSAAHKREALNIREYFEQMSLMIRDSSKQGYFARLLYPWLVHHAIVQLDEFVADRSAFGHNMKIIQSLPSAGFTLKNRLRLLRSRLRHARVLSH